MADAEYRVSRRLSSAVVHAGPGFLNSLLALGIAYKDRVPLLLISGGVRRRLYGTDAWLEIDQQGISGPLTKYSVRLEDESILDETLKKLIKKAFTKPYGPVMIEVPEDMWRKSLEADPKAIKLDALKGSPKKPALDDLRYVLDRLVRSSRPAILVCGEAVRLGIEKLLSEAAERLGAYIITTGNGRGACNEDNIRCLGRVGFGGGSIPADKVLENADTILVLGDELDDITTYNYTIYPEGDILVVTENPNIEKRPVYYDRVIMADPYIFLDELVKMLISREIKLDNRAWDDMIENYLKEWTAMVEEAISRRYEGYINPSLFFKKLGEAIPPDSIITGGQGVHIVYTYVFMKIRRPHTFLAATNLGGMSYAFPAALGAKIAAPDHEVIAVVGDGDFMMSIQDFETAVRENIPVKVIVVNDDSYRVLLLRQRIQRGGRVYGTLLGNPSFEELARNFGGEGYTLSSDTDIDDGIRMMLDSDRPFILELRINPEDLPPLNISASLRMSG
jgi:acetolactate synthase-1/2/3 large subunit